MIPDEQVQEVRDRSDIVDILGEFVDLKKSGKQYKARCPFHEERTPSFYVTPDKGYYKCFGCGESGDVFTFLMKRNGLDFVEAIRYVAARSGVELREVQGRRPEEDPLRPLYEVNAFARDFFRKALEDEDGGRLARDYLAARGVDAETAERFGLGFAPDAWRSLADAAKKHGIDAELLQQAGLQSTSEKAKEPFDTFRNRIVFPIENVGGRTVAFSARLLGKAEGGPKYVNSPETPIYRKGETCYGLSWAKHAIRKEGSVLLVEGNMDVVTLSASGVANVIAPLGTSLTDEQARLITRFSTRVFILFDSDPAGLKATFRAGDALLRAGAHPAVVTLPHGEDPDTLVRKEGAAGLKHYMDQAIDILDRKLQMLEEHDWFSDLGKTRNALDKLLPTLRAAADPALRDIYVSRVSERTGVRRDTLEAQVAQRPRARADAPVHAPGPDAPPERPRTPARKLPLMGAERELLLLMTKSRDFVERAVERVGPEDFADPAYRAIFEALLADPGLAVPLPAMDPVAAKRLEEILSDPQELTHPGRIFEDLMARFGVEAAQRANADVDRRIEMAGEEERERLKAEKIRLLVERGDQGNWSTRNVRKLRTLGQDS